MEKTDLKSCAKFLFESGVLSRTPRSGLRHLGGWDQSISEHILRVAYAGYVIAHLEIERGEQIDLNKVLLQCIFHDFGEARSIDLDYISQKYSKSDERQAVIDAVKGLNFGEKIISVFDEYEERLSKESVITKDADGIEMLCTLKEIIDNGNLQARSWVSPLIKRLRTDSAKALAEVIMDTSSDEWWYENKEDEYWVKGGKNKQK